MIQTHRFLSIVLLITCWVMLPLPATGSPQRGVGQKLELRDHLARDPLIVIVLRLDDLDESFDRMVEMLSRFAGDAESDEVQRMLQRADEKLGLSLRDDVMAQLGPEVALTLDLPPIDRLIGGLSNPTPESLAELLGGIGVLVQVRSEERIDRALGRLFELARAEITEQDGLRRVALPLDPPATDAAPAVPHLRELSVYYGLRGNRLALGFSRDWAHASLGARPPGQRLGDGEDFARVFSHLDRHPRMLFYANLPKMAALVRESRMLSALIQANSATQAFVDEFLTPEYVGTGIGVTAVDLPDGVRQTTFGPPGLSGGALAAAAIGAVAVPNLLNAIDRGKQKRTVADLRSLGVVCEAYALDHGSFPEPTPGWVPVASIAAEVEPVYIRHMPQSDGWGAPILYWSDGESYRIVSLGKGHEQDQDWSGPIETRTTTAFADDIVFGDGRFLVYPESAAP